MQIPDGSTIELYPDTVYVTSPSPMGMAEFQLKYDDHPALREQVQHLVDDFVRRHSHTLFGHVCGRCGNSCRREGVVIREQEMFRIRTRLGQTEDEFRANYLKPAPSWNPGDGIIQLKNGACPFLEPGPAGGIATCSIHDIRPSDCRLFASTASICTKSAGRLIEHLSWMKFEGPSQLTVCLKNGNQTEMADEKAFWELLVSQLESADATAEERLIRIATRTAKLVAEMIEEFHPDKVDEKFHEQLNGVRQLVSDLAHIGELGKEQPDMLEKLWADLRHLEDLASGRAVLPSLELVDLKPKRGRRVVWMHLTEDGVTAMYDLPRSLITPGNATQVPVYLNFGQYPQLQEAVQGLLYHLLTRNDDDFQAALTDTDPPCFLCGECCRVYSVEITPSDIDRLCELLNMTPAEFTEKYTIPNRFNWNPYNRILKKEPKTARYAHKEPRLMPLPVAGQKNRADKGCMFLEEREDGFWYCGVHSHKPDVCRRYQPTHSLCRRTNQLRHWGRQARNLMWVRLDKDAISTLPFQDARSGRAPRRFDRGRGSKLDHASKVVERHVEDILENARRELEAQQREAQRV